MRLSVATKLIEKGVEKNLQPQLWADLGCGTGLFTEALSTLLTAHSIIYAVDKDPDAIQHIKSSGQIKIETINLDFTEQELPFTPHQLDGMLMANALHYVASQPQLIVSLKKLIKPAGTLIIIEYEMDKPNAWVPYPIPLQMLQRLASQAKLSAAIKLAEVPSRFHHNNIYSACIKM